jgi:hypothetical protein
VFSVGFVRAALAEVSSTAYVYDYVMKLCRQQAAVIQNLENEHVRGIGQGEGQT